MDRHTNLMERFGRTIKTVDERPSLLQIVSMLLEAKCNVHQMTKTDETAISQPQD